MAMIMESPELRMLVSLHPKYKAPVGLIRGSPEGVLAFRGLFHLGRR